MHSWEQSGFGAGQGGRHEGAIRDADGIFGKMQAAKEDSYFHKKEQDQIQNIREHLISEISFHEDQIKRHEGAIMRHKEQMHKISEK